tara:strand:- start:251 stop:2590 length:2340 start_codon:yes stop_codon:yes gene_type:complete
MKNNFFIITFIFVVFSSFELFSQELEIKSSKIKYDDKNKVTLFEGSVEAKDEKNNKFFTSYAKHNKIQKLFETIGETKIITSEGYEILGSNIILDNEKKIIYSNYSTRIKDKDGNKILVSMFNYSILTNIFFSKGEIKITDLNNNKFNFSEIYIDEKKKKIIGTDVKGFLNDSDMLTNSENEPRIYANTMLFSQNTNTLEKGIFTYCKNRGKDKCPPWTLQSKKIKHDLTKKTIYYDNVVLKIYDFPIFFSPKFSHPDPTVKRRSGLLPPSLTNSTTLGSGIVAPYFWNMGNDRDITFTPKLYASENPLMLAEYRQDFEKSFLIVDAGYTQGYKKKNIRKTKGGRAHLFANFTKTLVDEDEKFSELEINLQNVSNDTYFKVYDIDTELVDKDKNIIENSINVSYQNKDFYFSAVPSIYEDMNKSGHLRNEYILPIAIEKNIMAHEKYGLLNLSTNLELRNYDTNKQNNMLVNSFNWKSNKWLNKLGFESYFENLTKTVNYESKNISEYKNDKENTEINSVLGYFAKLALYKTDNINKNLHTLTPKFLLRYAPGHMRNIQGGKLNYENLYSLNKVNDLDVIENGLSTSIGFEYKKKKLNKKKIAERNEFSFSVGQVISSKENIDIPASTSLDQKFSDVVGITEYNINDKLSVKYNFSLDQNYKTFNYNEIGSEFNFEKAKFNISYLQEKNHIGNQEFVQSNANFRIGSSNEINFSTKRNLLTSSAEFYNLSYNYINDCLKAGIGYRREFYTDRDIEPANTLMFTISIIPFANINGPSLSR